MDDSHHTWGVRPSDFLTVRDKVIKYFSTVVSQIFLCLQSDLHNISADSGLSHSPIQRETPQLSIGRPIKHVDHLQQPVHHDPGKQERGSRWRGLFRRKTGQKVSDSSSELSAVTDTKAGGNISVAGKKVTNNSLVLPERNAGAPPPLPPKNSNIFKPSIQVRGAAPPVMFPASHLRPDLQYPAPATLTVQDRDPRWDYVRSGSYYDQQILAMCPPPAQSPGSVVTSDSDSEVSRSVVRRTSSVGSSSSSRRSRAARTERYLNRKSRDGDTLVSGHSHVTRSASLEPHNISTPPPPPPRDPRLKNHVMDQMRTGRPVSYSFEHLRHNQQQHHHLPPGIHPLPPPHHQGIIQPHPSTIQSHSIVTSTPTQSHKTGVHRQQALEPASSIQSFVDQEPRSRKPIISYNPAGSNASSEGIGSQTSLDENQLLVSPAPVTTHASRAIPRVIGTCSPASISSKDSGCSASSNNAVRNSSVIQQQHDPNAAGFSTKKRRSKFEEAIRELENVFDDIAKDEDLLDRAERRDLPTAHQLLIWRDRDTDTPSHNTSADSAVSDFDTALNWNTSSSFEQVSSGVTRSRTPGHRRSGVSDKVNDDMMVRRISAANKVPTTLACLSEISNNQSYLSVSSVLGDVNNEEAAEDTDEPDIQVDDVLNRSVRDANLIKVIEPQPKFGVPLGPISGGANSDYLHAVPSGDKYRSTFNCMRNPDLVKDDLAFRHLRKDDNLATDPLTLGIVKDPRELVRSKTSWPFKNEAHHESPSPPAHHPNKSNPMIRSLSENIAQIIRKQSSKPGARLDDIITYKDLSDPLVYDTMKYTMDLISKKKQEGRPGKQSMQMHHKSQEKLMCQEKCGTTVYDLLRQIKSDPENIDKIDDSIVNTVTELDKDDSDEGVSSGSSPDLVDSPQLPDLVTKTPDLTSSKQVKIKSVLFSMKLNGTNCIVTLLSSPSQSSINMT